METKVPFYHVVNILLPGLVFIGACLFLFIDEIQVLFRAVLSPDDSIGFEVLVTVSCLAIAYEAGYIIFRLGAVLLDSALRKLFGGRDYLLFVAAKKAGATSLDMLSREYAYARTHIVLFILLAIVMGVSKHWLLFLVCISCITLFTLTARGHTKKIAVTIDKYLTEECK